MATKTFSVTLLAAMAMTVHATSLADVCTSSYAAAHLPASGFYGDYALAVDTSSVTANPVYNYSVGATYSDFFPAATFDYCNVTFTYSHEDRDDSVLLTLWLPTPDKFENRWLSTGGGGYAINSQLASLPGGVQYGAAAGQTDGGFGVDQEQAEDTFLVQNGTIDWQNVYMFGYQAIRELSLLGREFTKNFFEMNDTRLYTYYQVCTPPVPHLQDLPLITTYSRDAPKVDVKAGAKGSGLKTPTTVRPLAHQPSGLRSNRCSICIPTWWSIL